VKIISAFLDLFYSYGQKEEAILAGAPPSWEST
jgi:hypothetical protein